MNYSNIYSCIICLTFCAVLHASLIRGAVASETAEAFLDRYFSSIAQAQSYDDIEPLYVFTLAEKKQRPENALFKKLIMAMMKEEPAKVKILTKKIETNGKVRFDLAPAVMPQQYINAAKQPGFSMKGSVVLQKENEEWKVYKDYWTVKTVDKNGKFENSFGKDPDKESDREKQKEDLQSKQFLQTSKSTQLVSYESQFREKLMNNWKKEGNGKVHALFRLLPNGMLTDVHVKDETDQKSSENYAKQQLLAAQPFPVPKGGCKDKPCGWMYFDWNDNAQAMSGPYFDNQYPDWLAYKFGIKVRPYDSAIGDKISQILEKEQSSGIATVYLKLKNNGAIDKIFVRTSPKDAAVEKLAYSIISRSHPFGPLPENVRVQPYFEVHMQWSPNSRSVSTSQQTSPPNWLR